MGDIAFNGCVTNINLYKITNEPLIGLRCRLMVDYFPQLHPCVVLLVGACPNVGAP